MAGCGFRTAKASIMLIVLLLVCWVNPGGGHFFGLLGSLELVKDQSRVLCGQRLGAFCAERVRGGGDEVDTPLPEVKSEKTDNIHAVPHELEGLRGGGERTSSPVSVRASSPISDRVSERAEDRMYEQKRDSRRGRGRGAYRGADRGKNSLILENTNASGKPMANPVFKTSGGVKSAGNTSQLQDLEETRDVTAQDVGISVNMSVMGVDGTSSKSNRAPSVQVGASVQSVLAASQSPNIVRGLSAEPAVILGQREAAWVRLEELEAARNCTLDLQMELEDIKKILLRTRGQTDGSGLFQELREARKAADEAKSEFQARLEETARAHAARRVAESLWDKAEEARKSAEADKVRLMKEQTRALIEKEKAEFAREMAQKQQEKEKEEKVRAVKEREIAIKEKHEALKGREVAEKEAQLHREERLRLEAERELVVREREEAMQKKAAAEKEAEAHRVWGEMMERGKKTVEKEKEEFIRAVERSESVEIAKLKLAQEAYLKLNLEERERERQAGARELEAAVKAKEQAERERQEALRSKEIAESKSEVDSKESARMAEEVGRALRDHNETAVLLRRARAGLSFEQQEKTRVSAELGKVSARMRNLEGEVVRARVKEERGITSRDVELKRYQRSVRAELLALRNEKRISEDVLERRVGSLKQTSKWLSCCRRQDQQEAAGLRRVNVLLQRKADEANVTIESLRDGQAQERDQRQKAIERLKKTSEDRSANEGLLAQELEKMISIAETLRDRLSDANNLIEEHSKEREVSEENMQALRSRCAELEHKISRVHFISKERQAYIEEMEGRLVEIEKWCMSAGHKIEAFLNSEQQQQSPSPEPEPDD